MTGVDFVITNPRHHLAMFGPVISRLAAVHGLPVRVVSLCELRGYRTPVEEIARLGATCLPVAQVRLGKESHPLQRVREQAGGRLRAALQSLVWSTLVRWESVAAAGKPDLAVLPNDSAFPYNRIVTRLRAWGVPFILLQEGIRFELPAAHEGARYGQGGADVVGAWGPSSVRYFLDVGVPSGRVRAIGNPRLDAILATDWEAPAAVIRRALRLGNRVLLYLSNPIDAQGFCSTEDKHRLLGSFLSAAAGWLERTDTQTVVKIHPAESLPAYREVAAASACAGRTTVVRDADLYPLLKLARGAVGLGTTAGLEALVFGVPLGMLEVPQAGFLYDFVRQGAAVPLRADATLSARLTDLVDGAGSRSQARQAYLADQIVNLGTSAQAAADLVVAQLIPAAVA
jgi:hypothetical protein